MEIYIFMSTVEETVSKQRFQLLNIIRNVLLSIFDIFLHIMYSLCSFARLNSL